MPLIDDFLKLADGQAPTSTGDTNTTNAIPIGHVKDYGPGEELVMRFLVMTTVTSGGAATVQFVAASDSAAAASSPTDINQSAAIPKASLVAGAYWDVPIPEGTKEAFLLGIFRIATAALTAGAFDVWVGPKKTLDSVKQYV